MASRTRSVPAVLLFGGVVLVFIGLSSALGFTTTGMIASAATIAGLLYAGGVWFGGARAADAPVIFTRSLIVSGGRHHGRAVTDLFPQNREEVEARCRAALDGHASSFVCDGRSMEVAPVRVSSGFVPCAVLLAVTSDASAAAITPVA